MNTSKVETLILLGTESCENNNFEKALYYFDEILKDEPNNCDALFGRGVCLLKQNKHEQALPYINLSAKYGNAHAAEFLQEYSNKRTIQIEQDNNNRQPNYTSKYFGVKGWLALLCVTLVLSPIKYFGDFSEDVETFEKLIKTYKENSAHLSPSDQNFFKAQGAILTLIKAKSISSGFLQATYLLLLLGISSAIFIYKRNKKGIIFAKSVIVMSLIFQLSYPPLIYKTLGLTSSDLINQHGIQIILSLACCLAWLSYLNMSKRVKATFGSV